MTTLSEREREIIDRVAQGMSSKEIAAELGIKPRTIKAYLRNVSMRLGIDRPPSIRNRIKILRSLGFIDDTIRCQAYTPRERDVVQLVKLGLSNTEIAQRLNTTTSTVKVDFMRRIFDKVGCWNRVELAIRG